MFVRYGWPIRRCMRSRRKLEQPGGGLWATMQPVPPWEWRQRLTFQQPGLNARSLVGGSVLNRELLSNVSRALEI